MAAVVLLAALAGCGAVVTPPDSVAVDAPEEYAVSDVHVWTSGGTTEYRTKVVVAGTLRATTDASVPIPRVSVAFALASGETRTVNATYEVDQRVRTYDDLRNETLAPGPGIGVRAIFDPAGSVTVRNATIRVGTGA